MIKKIEKKSILFVILLFQILLLIVLKNVSFDVFNIGIKNKGISSIIIDKISPDTFNKLTLLLDKEDANYFKSCYEKKDEIYILKDYDKKELETITKKSMPINYLFYLALQKGFSSEDELSFSNTNIYNILSGSTEEQKSYYIKKLRDNMSGYSDKELEEFCVKNIQVEYQRLGYNINKIRNNYIFNKVVIIGFVLIVSFCLLILEIKISKAILIKNINIKDIKLLQALLVYILSLIYILKNNWIIFIVLLLVLITLFLIIIYINYLRRKFKKINKFITIFEDKYLSNKIYNIDLISLFILILGVINLLILYEVLNYRIFVGISSDTLITKILLVEALILIVISALVLINYLIKYFMSKRPIYKAEVYNKVVTEIENNKAKKKKRKKKKK